MNIKQILYDNLIIQLKEKEVAYEKYVKEVYEPSFKVFENEVEEWLNDTLENDFRPFHFNGGTLELIKQGWKGIEIKHGWGSEKSLRLSWSIDDLNSKQEDDTARKQLILLGEIAARFEEIEELYFNTLYPKYESIIEEKNVIEKEYKDFEKAVNNLKYEIRDSHRDEMVKLGFELKEFKPYYSYNYGNKQIEKCNHSISLQYGRSNWENTHVYGFRVLGKKGNKYKVEVNRGDDRKTVYDVLEKKFNKFINKVSNWEYEEADKNQKNAEQRFKDYAD